MRAYFVRDFYAKTLALLGLGVLAGTGALVDYWPAAVDLPTVGRASQFSVASNSLERPGVDPVSIASVRRSRAKATMMVEPAAAPLSGLPNIPVLAMAEPATPSELFVATSEPVAFLTLQPSQVQPAQFVLTEAVLVESPPAPAALSAPKTGDDGNFITSALKKTGSSIASVSKKTGVKTGASIVNAVRVVGGAFRRALPI